MNKGIQIGLAAAKLFRLVIAVILVVSVCRAFNADAQTETNLHLFGSILNDGAAPEADLVQGKDGNFYGTTDLGGTNNDGTVFQITSQGTLITLWQFNGTNGKNPSAGLVQGSDGNFYGTTLAGGTNNDGTIFRITTNGTLTTLWQFGSDPANGKNVPAGLVQAIDGNFYGTTEAGGTNAAGTVFKITSEGTLTTLWQFGSDVTNGINPFAALVQGSDSNFYGTTFASGINGSGTVFKVTPEGTLTTLCELGSGRTNGVGPYGALVQAANGNFYGTTEMGGTNNAGTLFRVTSEGTLTTLWQFGSSVTNGVAPFAALVLGSDGNFYGTTFASGINGSGTVFRLSSAGTLTALWQFGGGTLNSSRPISGLVQGSGGDFYGTTLNGGMNNSGTVFRISILLNPPANQISAIQLVGTNVVVSVPSVAYETYQLQYRNSLTSGTWSNVPKVSVTNSIGSLLTLTNLGGAVGPQGFYRFAITP